MLYKKIVVFIAIFAILWLWPRDASPAEIIPPIDNIVSIDQIVSSRYQEAANKAKTAFVIQSGIKGQYDQFRNKTNKIATEMEDRLVTKLLSVVGDVPQKHKEYAAFALGGTYTFLVKKNIDKTFNSPFSKNMKHYIRWSPEATELGVIYHF